MSLNLAIIVENGGRFFADQTALTHPGRQLTYAELAVQVHRFSSVLSDNGVEPGDKVGLMVINRPEFTIAYFAILHAGGVVVPMNILFVEDEVAYALEDSDASALVLWAPLDAGAKGFARVPGCRRLFVAGAGGGALPDRAIAMEESMETADAEADMAQTRPDDTAVILYTSGTTGQPKGAELTHSNLLLNAMCTSERVFSHSMHNREFLGPGNIALAVLPLFHSFGQTATQNGVLYGGATMRPLERFDPEEVLSVIEAEQITYFSGVPTMYFALLAVPDAVERFDLSSLKYCVSGGAAIPVEVKQQFEKRFSVNIQEAYGLSETSPLACIQEIWRTGKIGTIGPPVWGVEAMIANNGDTPVPTGEVGEILIRGHNIMKGYYNRPEATAEVMTNGWFHTGDLGRMDEDGDLFVVDRKKDMIIRGGFNVYPREVEEVLYRHPAVAECAVLGVPDEKLGEDVMAVISLHNGQTAGEADIIAYAKEHLAAYKYPRRIRIIDSLPKGPTGKILKRELRSKG
ncbi:MAG: long-chain fatty acid--CoA ligase [Verrucomicrobia bacterium]|nr:long-chain fatty acid--CoA ligase [Verrucomicrobiota bacterium]